MPRQLLGWFRNLAAAGLAPLQFTAGGVLLAGLATSGQAQAPPAAPPTAQVEFTRDIEPVLNSRCHECHGPKKSRGRLRLDQKAAALKGGMTGPAVVPGRSDDSQIMRRVLGLDGEDRMPLDADPLPDAQIALLRAWIDQGAPWPDAADAPAKAVEQEERGHWAYRAPVRPPVPRVGRSDWTRTPIDAFILARLEREGLSPSPEASREALARRVSLDLIGLPPSPADVDVFLADSRPDAYERLVDGLLASPHYGERWARPWLDLARYADSHGYEKDALRTMWKYRDWVIKALNDDMPFDRFTIEQIAGDMLPGATADQQVASGFHRNTLLNQEGGIDVEEARWETLLDRANTTATVWLGSTLACAQCHNHKYDPFSQRDYYRFLAFFDNVEYTVGGPSGGDRWIHEPTLDLPTAEQAERRRALMEELAGLNAQLSSPGPDIDAQQGTWEIEQHALTREWHVIAPDRVEADEATLTRRADDSVLASGAHPGRDRYVIEGGIAPGPLTGLRVEALPDASLPQGGPGRDHYGNFVLTGVTLDVLPATGAPVAVRFERATADDFAGGDPNALIAPPERQYARDVAAGWSINATRDATRVARQLVLDIEGASSDSPPQAPIDVPAGSRARVTLTFEGGNVGQALGRFRLSTTGADTPSRIVQIRARTRAALSVAAGARTEDQQRAANAEFRAHVGALKPARDRVAALEKELKALGIVTALVMKETPSHERPSTALRERGAYLSPGERVYADTPEILPPLGAREMPNRLGLARWLVSAANPLTARVVVNRAWEQFFGRGLVETSEDFGTQGAAPSHAALLDWLATEFVRLGWSQKALHRLIVLSSAYRQQAAAAPALIARDPYNRLVARGPRFRVDAETIRDVTLAASGLLRPTVGGPSVFPLQPDGIWDTPYSDAEWHTSEGGDRHRRGLYTFARRSSPYPSFMTLDATSREFCTVRRVRTNTPLQALTLMNDEAFFEAARALARRVIAEAPGDEALDHVLPRTRAARAFRWATSRTASQREIDTIVGSYARQLAHYSTRPEAAAHVMQAPEGSREVVVEAAWTLVANALLNLDEVVTK